MTRAVDPARIQAAAARLRAGLAKLPASRWDHREDYDAGIKAIAQIILDEGGGFHNRYDGSRVRMHGIASTSTTGLAGACRNWLARADKVGVPA